MSRKTDDQNRAAHTRRDFLKTSTVAAVGTTVAAHMNIIPGAYAQGSDEIRVGVVGVGGRGAGAIKDVLMAAPGVRIVAIGDVFKDRIDEAMTKFKGFAEDPEIKKLGNTVAVTPERTFVGFDAYEKVINASDVNYIILATPPGFRPQHIKAVVASGKTLFTEKPVAVDGPGIRMVLEAYEQSKTKGMHIAAGTQRRHDVGYNEAMKRIQGGAIGDIVATRAYWNQGGLWKKDRQKEWSDLEWQLRNWLYFTWLSGDHIVEQHVHNIDVSNWAMNAHPAKATGMGGRQVRTSPEYGHIFDHFAIDYEYPNGVHMMSMCRQIDGTTGNVSEALVGTKGTYVSQSNRQLITGANEWRYNDKPKSAYVLEHTNLISSVRAGKPINELKSVAETTLTAIMGRMSAYTGKTVTWEQALNSQEVLMPTKLDWSSNMPVPAVAVPGKTELV
ncbi:MAG: Gfo/Idh/MocA family oxidoreductase [Acidobacteriota bacterium]|nr:Gfo/Idh/MocA family oxidoreductase [Acidobacteriota bacterium]